NRTVRLLGIAGDLSCTESIADVTGDLPRQLHVLGEATLSLTRDENIHLPNVYDSLSPRDVVAECAESPRLVTYAVVSADASGGHTLTLGGTGFLREPTVWVGS